MTVHLVLTQEMPAPPEAVFDLVHDYDRRLEWDTLLRKAVLQGELAKGAVGVCTAKWHLGGYSFRFRYVSVDRPKVAAIKLVSRPPFFRTWAASIRHAPLPDGRSTCTYTMTFTCRPAVIEPLAERAFRAETTRRLASLARALSGRAEVTGG